MTAFGRSRFSLNGRAYILEIHSVNRKGFELMLNVPTDLTFLEIFIRMYLKNICLRGHLICKIFSDGGNNRGVSSDSLKRVHANLVSVAKELDPAYEVRFEHVLNVAMKGNHVLDIEEKEAQGIIGIALKDASSDFISMRVNEGEVLQQDISGRLTQIAKTCSLISEKGRLAPERMKERIFERLSDISAASEDHKDRLMREVIIFSDKCDVTEEMTRMGSHVDQMNTILSGDKTRKEEAVGRTLEFLLQEMLREVNTTSAKSQDLEIISEVIFIKREIEKIREQVQNIE